MTASTVSNYEISHQRDWWTFTVLVAVSTFAFLVLVGVFWVGYLGSDDTTYWEGAVGWTTHFPYVGGSHWALRHTLVLPLAVSRLIFGDGLLALSLPSLLYALAFIAMLTFWMQSALGKFATAIALGLVVTHPQFVLLSSTADVDIPEMFFIVSAFFLIDRAISNIKKREADRSAPNKPDLLWRLFSAGVLLGLGAISRETTIFALSAIMVLFIAGYGMPRRFYFFVGIGFAVVTGLETLWLWTRTGTLFYRYKIDLHHDSNISRWVDQGAAIPFVHPLVDPVTMFLFNHNFGLLTWIGVPLAFWLIGRSKTLSADARRMLVLLGTLSLVWALLAAGNWKILPLIPRYYLLPFVILSVLAGIALSQLWQQGRKRMAAGLGAVLLSGNLMALAIDNRNFMFGEYTLADLASKSTGTIHTDPLTLRRAGTLLKWRGVRDHVNSKPPASGELFYLNPAHATSNPDIRSGWGILERREVPLNDVQQALCRLLPANAPLFASKSRCEPHYVTLYRIS
jgi:4-amino-4-deoxy-L-arabinose transferase-like glycosyltransferase